MPLQDAVHGRGRLQDLVEAPQVVPDLAGAEVVVLPKVENFGDHFTRRGPRRPMRHGRLAAEPCLAVCRVPSPPPIEPLPRDAEVTTRARDVLRDLPFVPQDLQPPVPVSYTHLTLPTSDLV